MKRHVEETYVSCWASRKSVHTRWRSFLGNPWVAQGTDCEISFFLKPDKELSVSRHWNSFWLNSTGVWNHYKILHQTKKKNKIKFEIRSEKKTVHVRLVIDNVNVWRNCSGEWERKKQKVEQDTRFLIIKSFKTSRWTNMLFLACNIGVSQLLAREVVFLRLCLHGRALETGMRAQDAIG